MQNEVTCILWRSLNFNLQKLNTQKRPIIYRTLWLLPGTVQRWLMTCPVSLCVIFFIIKRSLSSTSTILNTSAIIHLQLKAFQHMRSILKVLIQVCIQRYLTCRKPELFMKGQSIVYVIHIKVYWNASNHFRHI